MLPNFYVYSVTPLKSNLLVATSYGPLFLDEDDFNRFAVRPEWLIQNFDTPEAYKLLSVIKVYYMHLAQELIERGELL